MISRRKFIKAGIMAGMAVTLPVRWLGGRKAYAFSQSPRNIRKFIVPLPGLGPNGIPTLTPKTAVDPRTGLLTDFYSIRMGEFKQRLHPDLPKDTTLWGYGDDGRGQQRYLGGVIEAEQGRPVQVTVANKLPKKHPLPVDRSLMGAEGADNRAVLHLHGGFVPWTSDGNPFSWFTPPGGEVGENFLNRGPRPGTAEYYYPNQQSARLMWYHDHALGTTRLNAYAGLATAYLLRDDAERSLIKNGIIPSREVPLIIQDKTFVDGSDPNYIWGKPGDLWYPYLYEPSRWDLGTDVDPPAAGTLPPPVPSAVPEFFSDTMLVNGTCYPFLEVEPRHYRFRILNASQARFYNLQLYYADGSGNEANLAKAGPRFIQIGTEGGFLPFPAALNDPPVKIAFDPNSGNAVGYTLLLAPAERADIIIDFSKVPEGARLILYNDAPAPFPMGADLNDYFTGAGATNTSPGYGPNTRTLMQFRVVRRVGSPDSASLGLLEKIAVQGEHLAERAFRALLPAVRRHDTRNAAAIRNLTLNEDFDGNARLIQRLGTDQQNGVNNQGLPTWGRDYMDLPTETPHAGDLEIWRIFNLTGDTHPIHFHLVNVQVLSRQPFDVPGWNGTPVFTGPAGAPDANERGWKETVRMNPGECTTVAMKFDLPKVPFYVPLSPRTHGHEYVWHCHILEHEEHDMMRPLVVMP